MRAATAPTTALAAALLLLAGADARADGEPPTDAGAVEIEPIAEEDEEDAEDEEVEVVISSSRVREKLEEAPSIVTVLTREELARLGYRSLGEVLRNVVGFGVNDNGHWPDTGVRGINDRTTYGDKLKMLVDGHNMGWRQFNRNYHDPTWAAIEDIARIEVIRGPASAVWGSNALNGLVNIVTRDWDDLEGGEVTLGFDHTSDHHLVSARVARSAEPWSFYGSVSYYDDDADALLAPVRELDLVAGAPRLFVAGDREDGVSVDLKARYRSFQLDLRKSRHDTGAPLSTFSVLGGDDSRFVTDRHIVRLRFNDTLRSDLELWAELAIDDYRFAAGTVYEANAFATEASTPAEGGAGRFVRKMEAHDRRYELSARASFAPTPAFQALLGVELEVLDLVRWHFPEVWQHLDLATPEFDNFQVGVHGQVRYSPLKALGLSVGGRYDYDGVYGSVGTARAGVVLRLPEGLYVKGLFGMAYKAPSFHDLYYFRRDAFYGNPDLTPESSITAEGQVGFKSRALHARVSGFYTRISDLIGYAQREGSAPLHAADAFPASQRPSGDRDYSQKTNADYITTAGFEAELWLDLFDVALLQLHGTYRAPRDHLGERLAYASEWTAGGALTVRIHAHLEATFRGLAVGDKPVPPRALAEPGLATSWTAATDPTLEAPAHFVGTFVLRAHGILGDALSVQLKLDNITDVDHWDAGRDVLYPQRGFQGTLWATLRL